MKIKNVKLSEVKSYENNPRKNYYCSVIIERWEKLTKKRAIKLK